jgi:hypothetical protein
MESPLGTGLLGDLGGSSPRDSWPQDITHTYTVQAPLGWTEAELDRTQRHIGDFFTLFAGTRAAPFAIEYLDGSHEVIAFRLYDNACGRIPIHDKGILGCRVARLPVELLPRLVCEMESSTTFQHAIRRAIDWIATGVRPSETVESRALLIYVALEAMAWATATAEPLALSHQSLRNLRLADLIRLALRLSSIPRDLPARMQSIPDLELASKHAKNCVDGPDAIVAIRNALVHASSLGNEPSLDAIHAASTLALQYTRLLILHQLRYDGLYNDYSESGSWGEPMQVPWQREPKASQESQQDSR